MDHKIDFSFHVQTVEDVIKVVVDQEPLLTRITTASLAILPITDKFYDDGDANKVFITYYYGGKTALNSVSYMYEGPLAKELVAELKTRGWTVA